jgi:hypothetical protein
MVVFYDNGHSAECKDLPSVERVCTQLMVSYGTMVIRKPAGGKAPKRIKGSVSGLMYFLLLKYCVR